MSEQEKDLAQIDDLEIEALSDEDLEDVAGGGCEQNSCSTSDCSNGSSEREIAAL